MPVTAPDRDAVRARIVEAWRDAVQPGDDRICNPTYDDEGVGAYFRGRTWHGHDVASLRYHEVGLSFFTAEAFAYYLAAYMLAVLDDATAADVIHDGILFHLSPRQLGKQWADSYRARIACLSPAQRDAVVAYLAWCAAQDGHGRAELDDTIAYLRSGEPPSSNDASGLDRLLKLAGAARRAHDTLEWLLLSNTTVSDDDLAAVRELPAVRQLDLGHTSITDAGLAQLRGLATLTSLDLSGCRAITAAGLAHVATLPALVELKLPNVELDDDRVRALAPLSLVHLDATHARAVTADGWAALDVRRLEQLDMYGCDAPDALLARIGDAGCLRTLTARAIGDAGLAALARTPIEKLDVGTTANLTEPGLAALARSSTLRELSLHGPLPRLPSGWPALDALTLLDVELTAALGGAVAALPIRDLRVHARTIELGALAALASAPALVSLTLWCNGATVALDELARATALRELRVHTATVTGIAAPALVSLALDRVTIDLAALAPLPIRALALEDMPVDAAGLAAVAMVPGLARLRLARTNAAAPELAAFRRAHPSIEVVEL